MTEFTQHDISRDETPVYVTRSELKGLISDPADKYAVVRCIGEQLIASQTEATEVSAGRACDIVNEHEVANGRFPKFFVAIIV